MKCDNSIFVVSFAFLLFVVPEKVVGENDEYFEFESDEPRQNFAAANFQDDDDLKQDFAESSTSAPSNFAPNNFAAANVQGDKFPYNFAAANFQDDNLQNNFAAANFQGDKFPNNFAAANFQDDDLQNNFAAANFQDGDPQANFAQNAHPFYLNPGHQQQPPAHHRFGIGPFTPKGAKWGPRHFAPLGPNPVDPGVKVSGYSYGYKYTTDQNGKVVVSPLGAPGSRDFPSSFGHHPLSGSLSSLSLYDEELWNPRNRLFGTENMRKSDRMFGFDDKSPNTHQNLKENGPRF